MRLEVIKMDSENKKWKMSFDFKNKTDLIERNYCGNYPEQMPIYMFVDFEYKEITVETRNYGISGTPLRQFNGLFIAIKLPNNVDATKLKNDIEKYYLDKFDKLHKCFYTEYHNGNLKGYFTPESNDFQWDIIFDIENGVNLTLMDNGGLWDIYDYYEYNRPKIAGLSVDELNELAEKEYNDAIDNGVVIIGGKDAILNFLIGD